MRRIHGDQLITVPSTAQNEISLTHLEATLRDLYQRDETVAAIILTLGTTDAFGIDDLAAVTALRDRLTVEYHLSFAPHLHADAVIGWPWPAFRATTPPPICSAFVRWSRPSAAPSPWKSGRPSPI